MTENASYKLPPNWTWTQLGNVANIVGGGTPRRDRPEYYAGGNIPWATPTDIDPDEIKFITDTSEKITEKGLKESSARLLPKGTILFSSRASIGKIAISGEKMATNQGFANVIPFDGIDSKFIAYGMRNFVRNIESLGSGPKTNILFFEKNGKTNKIWYYKLEGSKQSRDSEIKRTTFTRVNSISDNDLEDCLKKWKDKKTSENSWYVEIKDIIKNNYDLSANNPNEKTDSKLSDPVKLLSDVLEKEIEIKNILDDIKQQIT